MALKYQPSFLPSQRIPYQLCAVSCVCLSPVSNWSVGRTMLKDNNISMISMAVFHLSESEARACFMCQSHIFVLVLSTVLQV